MNPSGGVETRRGGQVERRGDLEDGARTSTGVAGADHAAAITGAIVCQPITPVSGGGCVDGGSGIVSNVRTSGRAKVAGRPRRPPAPPARLASARTTAGTARRHRTGRGTVPARSRRRSGSVPAATPSMLTVPSDAIRVPPAGAPPTWSSNSPSGTRSWTSDSDADGRHQQAARHWSSPAEPSNTPVARGVPDQLADDRTASASTAAGSTAAGGGTAGADPKSVSTS